MYLDEGETQYNVHTSHNNFANKKRKDNNNNQSIIEQS